MYEPMEPFKKNYSAEVFQPVVHVDVTQNGPLFWFSEWCEEHCRQRFGYAYFSRDSDNIIRFFFENENDAIIFKLRWG